ncbi:hypothetical protein PALB_31390 [Pseudoalteromonas luteoviolacea B = ATCC 29581]|nr:hypothetical protein PALB_31390 [Pseudoalteromonas luteoviolacea B = ATCC 29581]
MTKFSHIAGIFAVIFAGNVFASGEAKEAAPAEMIAELTQMCTDWAKDDAVEASVLKKYVLDCVNEELAANDYLPVTDVDVK